VNLGKCGKVNCTNWEHPHWNTPSYKARAVARSSVMGGGGNVIWGKNTNNCNFQAKICMKNIFVCDI
jgi:hypothetical protein